MNRLTSRLAGLSVERRGLMWCILVAISGLALIGHIDPGWVTGLWKEAPEEFIDNAATRDDDGPESQGPPDNVSPVSLSNSDAVIVVEGEDFFTPAAAEALRGSVAELEELDQVERILWMDRVPILNIFGLPEPLLPRSSASELLFEEARNKAADHPLVGGHLLSPDDKTLLLLVTFNAFHLFDNADATSKLRDTARQAAERYPEVDFRIRVTGRVPAAIAAIEAHEANQLKYQIIGYGMIVLMTTILFRGVRAVIIVSLAPAIGVFWTTGIIQFLDYSDNPLIDVILPILVSLVGLTDGVHLMVQIRKLRASGEPIRRATRLGLEQVGLACFLTSVTTAIGFGSLMLAESTWVQQFGMCSTIGVLLCFIAVVTVIPLSCSSWLGRNVHLGQESSLIDRNLSKVGVLVVFVLRHRRVMAVSGVVITLVLCGISLTLTPDQRESDGLPESAEATQALQHLDRVMGGLELSNVDLSWGDRIASDSPEILVVVRKIDDLLNREPLIGSPLSIRNLVDAQPGSGPPSERMTLLELLPPPLKRAFYTPEENRATVTFRVQDLGIARYGPVFRRIEQGLQQIHDEHPDFTFSLDGRAVWRWRNLYQIVVDLASSLGTAAVIIFIVLTIVFRSIRLGLISIIPNLFPLAFTGAYLALAGFNLEIVMVCNFTVCLGIAVDDTIHFMTRFREQREVAASDDEAIEQAFTGVGTALIMTTLVLVAGFSIVTLSDSRDHRIFATMGALTISAALFCDLIFLPALLGVFSSRRQGRVLDQQL